MPLDKTSASLYNSKDDGTHLVMGLVCKTSKIGFDSRRRLSQGDIMKNVLLLNADFTPRRVVTLERAILLLFRQRAELVAARDGEVLRSPSMTMEYPSVIRMKQYRNVPRMKATWRAKEVLKRDDYTCIYCGKKLKSDEATLEHIYPKSRCKKEGIPANTWVNTACACKKCQTKKGDRTIGESGMKLLWEPRIPRTNYVVVSDDCDDTWKYYIEGH